MFEYILAGFTGSFFSYFCVYYVGVETHAFVLGTVSDRVIQKLDDYNKKNERFYIKMERTLQQLTQTRPIPLDSVYS